VCCSTAHSACRLVIVSPALFVQGVLLGTC
jgi:hypothetical protein